MGRYKPCLGCWAALTAHNYVDYLGRDGRDHQRFRMSFNPNFGAYYRESIEDIVRWLPHVLNPPRTPSGWGNLIHYLVSDPRSTAWPWMDQGGDQGGRTMSVAALSRRIAPTGARWVDGGWETTIASKVAPERPWNTGSDTEYDGEERILDISDHAGKKLGTGRDKARKVERVMGEADQKRFLWDLDGYSSSPQTFIDTITFFHKKGVSYAEMSEVSRLDGRLGYSDTQIARLRNGKTGHKTYDTDRTAPARRVVSRSGRVPSTSESTTSVRKIQKRLNDQGRERIIRAMSEGDLLLYKKGSKLKWEDLDSGLLQELADMRGEYSVSSMATELRGQPDEGRGLRKILNNWFGEWAPGTSVVHPESEVDVQMGGQTPSGSTYQTYPTYPTHPFTSTSQGFDVAYSQPPGPVSYGPYPPEPADTTMRDATPPGRQYDPATGRYNVAPPPTQPAQTSTQQGSYYVEPSPSNTPAYDELYDVSDDERYGRYGRGWDGSAAITGELANDPEQTGVPPAQVEEPVSIDEINSLRDRQPARPVRGTPYDVIILPYKRGIPPEVIDSYLQDGQDPAEVEALRAANADRPRLDLRNRPGIIAYDHRTLPASNGRTVQDFSLRLRLVALDEEAAAQRDRIAEETVADHNARLNQAYRYGNDQLHFNLEFLHEDDPREAHETIYLTGEPFTGTATQTRWSIHTPRDTRFHEVAHFYGTDDENLDPAVDEDGNPVDQRAFHQSSGSSRVYGDDSVMGPSSADPSQPGKNVYQRHIDKIGNTAQDNSLTVVVPDRVGDQLHQRHIDTIGSTVPPGVLAPQRSQAVPGVTTVDRVHIAHPQEELNQFEQQKMEAFHESVITAAKGTSQAVIVLGSARLGADPTEAGMATVNHLLEIYLGAHDESEVPTVVTHARVDENLLNVLAAYNVTVIYRASVGPKVTSGSGRPMAQLDNPWVARKPDGTLIPLGPRMTTDVLKQGVGNRPTAERPTPELADWLSTGDWAKSLEKFNQLRNQLTSPINRDGLVSVVKRTERRVPEFAGSRAIVELSDRGKTDLAQAYLTGVQPDGAAVEHVDGDRGAVLVKPLREHADVPLGTLVDLAHGARDQQPAATVMRAIELVTQGRFKEADEYVRKHKDGLDGAVRTAWVRRLQDLATEYPEHTDLLNNLSQTVLTC